MAQKRWTLKILDAKAAHRAWSKRRVLVAIAAAAIAASVAAPAVAHAEKAPSVPVNQPAIVRVDTPVAHSADAKLGDITFTRVDDDFGGFGSLCDKGLA